MSTRRYFDKPNSGGSQAKRVVKKTTEDANILDGKTNFIPLDFPDDDAGSRTFKKHDKSERTGEKVRGLPSSSSRHSDNKPGNKGPKGGRNAFQKQRDDNTFKNQSHGKKNAKRKVEELESEKAPDVVEDQFPGDAPVDPKLLQKYDRGKGIDTRRFNTPFHKDMMKKKEETIYFTKQQAARTHLLRTETAGFLEAEGPLEDTTRITQKDLSKSVDLQSQSKHFDLRLKEFGPYGFQYTRNGRFLLLYGKQGHVATMDWLTKTLACEMHVQERINCGQWLHQETMFALAQKQWLHIYDNKGVELHCIKRLFQVNCMDFLPYHFLLATGSETGFVSWLDISLGQLIAQFNTKSGRLSTLRKNPASAVLHLGHANGTITLWSPNVAEPLVKFLSHESAVRALDIDASGRYMASAGCDRKMKIWDLRMYRTVQEVDMYQAPVSLGFSQTGLLAVGMERSVEVMRGVGGAGNVEVYMKHFVKSGLAHVEFCPFEDVLGCGYSEGFTSLLIPGAGEAHLDALEANPFQTKRQRQEMEVHSLLEKIPAELIALDPTQIAHIHEPSLQEQLEEKSRVLYARMPKVEFTPKYKAIGGSAGWTKRKGTVKEEKKRQQIKEAVRERKKLLEMREEAGSGEDAVEKVTTEESVFDRFRKKNV